MPNSKSASSVFPRPDRKIESVAAPNFGASAPANSATLKVALDVRLIGHSGIGNYLRGLLYGFAEIGAPIEWTFIGPEAEVPPRTTVAQWIPFNAPPYSREEFFHYPKPPSIDLLHYPHYNLPFGAPRATVVTVYDLFHLLYGSIGKRMYQRFFLSRLARSRARIITISEKSREDLEARSSIAPERVTVIDLGPGMPSRSEPANSREAPPFRMSDGREVNSPWFLSVGIDKAHKNMDFLVAAMALWYRRRPEAPPLIWTGLKPEEIAARTATIPAHARGKIHFSPYVTPAEAESLYSGALALIFPSLDEGFGFPPLEAMSRGVPVLCSRRRPMTDLLGNAPLWFDPKDSSTLWRGLDRLLDERGLHDEAVERGLKQAAKYSWAETARKTLEVYRATVESTVKKKRAANKEPEKEEAQLG